jgi:UDP-N-acetylglucosamine 4,6-dehydratase
VLGAENVISASIDAGVKRVIALSTDKAVNPINLYGATKLCSDKLFVAGNSLAGSQGTRFAIVRYGNVLGSRGSVVPFFKARRPQGVLPITDKRMTRFWITLEEGVRFVVRCLSAMHGGEIFIPKIPSMRVVDLASTIGPECRQEIVGIRPGEKLHELLVPKDEAMNTLEFDDYFIIRPAYQQWDSDKNLDYGDDAGRPVPPEFEFSSDKNSRWLSVEELHRLLQ